MNMKSKIYVIVIILLGLINTKAITEVSSDQNIVITESDCTYKKLERSIPVSAIGEPVSGVNLKPPVWTKATDSSPGYCSVDGSMAPVSKEPNAKPINFRVILPASWSRRAAQIGGGV